MPQYPSLIALSSLNGKNGFRLDAGATEAYGGTAVAVGDVNGDGLADLVVGVPYSGASSPDDPGKLHVVFGRVGGFSSALALDALNGANGFTVVSAQGGNHFAETMEVADVNGDGIDDIIVGAMLGDVGANYAAGNSFVIFGKASGFASLLNVTSLTGANGFRIDGIDKVDESGFSVSAGDINGDGVDDVIIGAPFEDHGSGFTQGAAYVVFGKSAGNPAALNLSTLNGSNGFTLLGPETLGQAARAVASAGDINGDGFDDVLVGAPKLDPSGYSVSAKGEVFVVFGKASGFTSGLELSALNGQNGFRLLGETAGDHTGGHLAAAGDINADGFGDFFIDNNVIFGKASGFASSIELSSLNGVNGFSIYGGFAMAVGDVNGDGFDDIAIGSPYTSGGGATYVIFGKASGFAADFDVSQLNGANGFKIGGVTPFDHSGAAVAGGDVNGDGLDDILTGTPGTDPNGHSYAGGASVVFGRIPDAAVNRTGTNIAQTLVGGNFDDKLAALGGGDSLFGNGGKDTMDGGTGNDSLIGGAGDDSMLGGTGKDTLTGGAENDTMSGDDGNDLLGGSDGNDLFFGGTGADRMFGGDGNDSFNGAAGKDTIVGGAGIDIFSFTAANWGGDTVSDFDDGADLLRFKRFIADNVTDFTITGNGTANVTIAIGVQALHLHGDANGAITLTNADFQFLA